MVSPREQIVEKTDSPTPQILQVRERNVMLHLHLAIREQIL